MTNETNQTAPEVPAPNAASTRRAFAIVTKLVVTYGVIGVIVLGTVATVAALGGSVSAFMWIRAAILLAAAPLFFVWARRASRGMLGSFDRLRTVTTIVPIAIVAVDLIPGICPVWYTVMQGASVLPLIAIAVMMRRSPLTAVLVKSDPVSHAKSTRTHNSRRAD